MKPLAILVREMKQERLAQDTDARANYLEAACARAFARNRRCLENAPPFAVGRHERLDEEGGVLSQWNRRKLRKRVNQ